MGLTQNASDSSSPQNALSSYWGWLINAILDRVVPELLCNMQWDSYIIELIPGPSNRHLCNSVAATINPPGKINRCPTRLFNNRIRDIFSAKCKIRFMPAFSVSQPLTLSPISSVRYGYLYLHHLSPGFSVPYLSLISPLAALA